MSPRSFVALLALGLGLPSLFASTTLAQTSERHPYVGSPERVGLELRIGTFNPELGASRADFVRFYGGDSGPLVAGEIDIWAYRIPYVGPIGIGLGMGWARYSGHTCTVQTDGSCTPVASESARFTLYPFTALAVLRIDVLARELRIPLVISPKIGAGYTRFRSQAGSATDGRGGSFGLVWGVQFALELDAFEPRAARSLDEQWGINHSYLFFELYGSQLNSGMDVGSDLAWVAGLGLQF